MEPYLLDWYGPNATDKNLDELIEERGHPLLRIAGGATCIVQANDVKAHGPYSREYKKLEEGDALDALESGLKVFAVSREIVMKRASDAWDSLDQRQIVRGFV